MDEAPQPHLAAVGDRLTQAGEGRRTGAARVNNRRHPACRAALIGFAPHVVGVDKDVGVQIDQARTHQPAADIPNPHGVGCRDIRLDRSNRAVVNRHVGLGPERPARVNDFPALE